MLCEAHYVDLEVCGLAADVLYRACPNLEYARLVGVVCDLPLCGASAGRHNRYKNVVEVGNLYVEYGQFH